MRNLWGFLGRSRLQPAVAPAPTVSSITHASGPWRATANGVIGTGFVSGATVKINGVACTSVVFSSSTSISFDSPVFTANGGPYGVVVTNPDTQTGTLAAAYTVAGDYLDVPSAKVLAALDPAVGVTGTTWTDAVHGNVFTATTVTQDSSGLNGQKRIVFPDSADNQLTCAGLTSASSKGQVIAIGKVITTDFDNGLWELGTNSSFFMFANVNIFEDALSSVRYGPTPSGLSSGASFAYQVTADADGNWTQSLNGSVLATNTGNTVQWAPNTIVGGGSATFNGELDFVFILVDELSVAEQTMLAAYAMARWGVTL